MLRHDETSCYTIDKLDRFLLDISDIKTCITCIVVFLYNVCVEKICCWKNTFFIAAAIGWLYSLYNRPGLAEPQLKPSVSGVSQSVGPPDPPLFGANLRGFPGATGCLLLSRVAQRPVATLAPRATSWEPHGGSEGG